MTSTLTVTMTRKAFCGALAAGTVTLLLPGCGGGGDAAAPAPPPAAGCAETIANNHGHTLVINTADLDAPADKTYNIQGTALHDHTVTLSVAQLRDLKGGMTVNTTSSTGGGHEHSVSIRCT